MRTCGKRQLDRLAVLSDDRVLGVIVSIGDIRMWQIAKFEQGCTLRLFDLGEFSVKAGDLIAEGAH